MLWKPLNAKAFAGAAALWSAKVFNKKQTHFAAVPGFLQPLMQSEVDETAAAVAKAIGLLLGCFSHINLKKKTPRLLTQTGNVSGGRLKMFLLCARPL